MNLLLIGHSVLDFIHDQGTIIHKPGGIYYSCLGLMNESQPGDKFYLLTSIDENSFAMFENVYSVFDLSYSKKVDQISKVDLFHHMQGERHECYASIASKLEIDETISFEKFNGVLINMVTGLDINLEYLEWIRSKFDGPIYFDVHTMSRGIDEKGRRNFRPIPDVEHWLRNIDILQCNETELGMIKSGLDEQSIIKYCLDQGIGIIAVTRGVEGASLYFIDSGEIKRIDKKVSTAAENKCIGCGDIFGTVFFYHYLKSGDIVLSFQTAVQQANSFALSKK